jgi:hypothetical protein
MINPTNNIDVNNSSIYILNSSSSNNTVTDYLSDRISIEIHCILFDFIEQKDIQSLSSTSKTLAGSIKYANAPKRYDFLENLIIEILKEDFSTKAMARYNEIADGFKNFENKSAEKCEAMCDAISGLFNDLLPVTLFYQCEKNGIYKDRDLFIQLFQNLDKKEKSFNVLGEPGKTFNTKTLYAYLSLVEDNYISPTDIKLNLFCTFEKSIAKYVQDLIKNNTSLNQVYLHFDKWNSTDLTSLLLEVKKNNIIDELEIVESIKNSSDCNISSISHTILKDDFSITTYQNELSFKKNSLPL